MILLFKLVGGRCLYEKIDARDMDAESAEHKGDLHLSILPHV